MVFKLSVILLAILAMVCQFSSPSAGDDSPFVDISPDDPTAVASAEFAVTENNRKVHLNLQFVKLGKAQKQLNAGVYRLTLVAKSGISDHDCLAVVTVNSDGSKQLNSFLDFSD